MKKILLVSLSPSPGMVNHIYLLANELVRRCPVSVLVSKLADERLFSSQVRVIKANTDSPYLTLSNIKPIEIVGLWRRIVKINPDVIHFLGPHPWNIPLSLMLPGKNIVHSIHDPFPHTGERYPILLRLFNRWFVRFVSQAVVVYGNHSLRQVKPWMKNKLIAAVPLGSAPCSSEAPALPANRNILFFGRIQPYKGLEVLLKAVALLQNRGCSLMLTIAGEGNLDPYRDQLSAIRHLDLHHRRIDEREVDAFFQNARFVVLPYHDATQSGIIPISYSNRRPVIATNTGALPEFVRHQHTGVITECKNPEKLADVIEALLEDEAWNRKLADQALDYFNRHLTTANMADTLEQEVYDKLIGINFREKDVKCR